MNAGDLRLAGQALREALGRPFVRAAVAIVVIALAARIVVLIVAPAGHPQGDALLYDEAARSLAGLTHAPGRCICDAVFYRGFGYPGLLSLLYRVTTDYDLVRAVQALSWVAAALIVFAVAARLAGPVRGLLAAALVTLQPNILDFFLLLLTESALVVLVTGSVAVLVLLVPKRPRAGAALYGVLLGALAISHPAYQYYWVVGLPLLWLVASGRRVLMAAAVAAITALVIALPFHLEHPGQPWRMGQGGAGFGAGGAWTLYSATRTTDEAKGLLPLDNQVAESYASPTYAHAVQTAKRQGKLDPAIADAVPPSGLFHVSDGAYLLAAWRHVKSDPLGVASRMTDNTWRLFTTTAPVLAGALGGPLGDLTPALRYLLLLAGFAGLVLIAFDRHWRLLLVLLIPVAWTAVVFGALTVPDIRYSFPALHLLGAAAAYLIAPKARRAAAPTLAPR